MACYTLAMPDPGSSLRAMALHLNEFDLVEVRVRCMQIAGRIADETRALELQQAVVDAFGFVEQVLLLGQAMESPVFGARQEALDAIAAMERAARQ